MARPATGATHFSVATVQTVLDRIDASAQSAGLSRSAYVLQWLPEAQEHQSATEQDNAAKAVRKGYPARK